MPAPDGWDTVELSASVEAYMEMLTLTEGGLIPNKQAIVRRLVEGPLARRTEKAVGRRMSNISHIMQKHGLPTVPGYKPQANVGVNIEGQLWAALQSHGLVSQLSIPIVANAPQRAFGQAYVDADEESASKRLDPFEVDPDLVDRGVRGHATTQNALAQWLRGWRLVPRSPGVSEPKYDLGWMDGPELFVSEVKSLTSENEEKQLRLGLGQVLRYRYLLGCTGRTVRAVLAVERQPADPSWTPLCESLGVILCWPPTFAALSSVLELQ